MLQCLVNSHHHDLFRFFSLFFAYIKLFIDPKEPGVRTPRWKVTLLWYGSRQWAPAGRVVAQVTVAGDAIITVFFQHTKSVSGV